VGPAPAGGQPAGWFADPYGRFQLRYWDGAAWTAHVSTNGQQQVDPMGTSTVVPFTIPTATAPPIVAPGATVHGIAGGDPSSLPPPPIAPPSGPSTVTLPVNGGPAAATGIGRVLESMRPDSAERTRPSLSMALAGIGGFLLAVGALILTGDDPARVTIVLVSLAVLAAAVAAAIWLKRMHAAPSAALGGLIVGLVGFGSAATIGDGDAGVLTFLVIGGLHLVAWFVGPFKGKTLLLGLGLFVLVGAVASLVDGESDRNGSAIAECEDLLDDGDFEEFDENNCDEVLFSESGNDEIVPQLVGDNIGSTGWVYLASAAGLLFATAWADRKGFRGTGTGVASAAIASALAGTAFAAVDLGGTGAWVLVTIVGIAVCLVGSFGARRATTWWGSFLVAVGLIAVVALSLKPESNTGIAGVAFLAGALLIGVPALIRKVKAAQDG
jgi:hypothetical protein